MTIRTTSSQWLVVFLLFLFYSPCFSQSESECEGVVCVHIPTTSALEVVGSAGTSIQLNPEVSEAGGSLDVSSSSDSSLWVNYSVTKGSINAPNLRIEARLTSGSLPSGTSLQVVASECSGTGQGDFGVSSGVVKLSGQNQTVINDIKTCYTGTGIQNGHRLVYSLQVTNYALLRATSAGSVTIMYTISD